MKSLILATAAVVALGFGGAGAANAWSGHSGSAMGPNTGTTSESGTSMRHHPSVHIMTSRNVRQAQRMLRRDGLYHGAIDGRLGPETRQALSRFQKKNGLRVTASLDSSTMASLMGRGTVGAGSSMHHRMTTHTTPNQMPPANGTSGQNLETGGTPSTPSGTPNTGTNPGSNTGTNR